MEYGLEPEIMVDFTVPPWEKIPAVLIEIHSNFAKRTRNIDRFFI